MSKIQINTAGKIFLISIFLLIASFFMLFYNLSGITGFLGADINVSIKSKTDGSLFLSYDPIVNLTETQTMIVEFVNTGTSNYTARIEITVYMYNDTTGSLQELANYYDMSVFLRPGERKNFKTFFLPNRIGTYYIKARVPYDAKIAEYWGSFFVIYDVQVLPNYVYVITYVEGGAIPAPTRFGVGYLDLEYEDKVDLYPGEKVLLSIKLNNTGTVNLHNLKFYSSTTEYIGFEVNPKEIYELGVNASNIFLVSLNVSEDIPLGEYDFYFEVDSLEVKRTGIIRLNVTLERPPTRDEVYEIILNYEYLITELDHEIYLTSLKELDTSRAERYLDNARKNLQKAKKYFDQENYEDAKDILDLVKRDLENVVFELAAISFRVYIFPAYAPFIILILLLMIIICIILFVYLYKKRKKKKVKRPRIIKEFAEEET